METQELNEYRCDSRIIRCLDYICQKENIDKTSSTIFNMSLELICSVYTTLWICNLSILSFYPILLMLIIWLTRPEHIYRKRRHEYLHSHNMKGPYGLDTIDKLPEYLYL